MTGHAQDPRADARHHVPSPAVLRHTRSEARQPAAASGASAPGAAPFAGGSRYQPDPVFEAVVRSIEAPLAAHLAKLRDDRARAAYRRHRWGRFVSGYEHFMDVTLWRGLIWFIVIGLSVTVWTHVVWPKVIFPAGTWLLRALGVQ